MTIKLSDEPALGNLYLCSYSSGIALLFEGDEDFIQRWYNWAVNTGLLGSLSRLNRWAHPRGSVGYVIIRAKWFTDPVSRETTRYEPMEQIQNALTAQFRAEMIMNREIAPLQDRWSDETCEYTLEYDEVRLARESRARAAAFLDTHFKRSGGILNNVPHGDGAYSVNLPAGAEQP